jgi:hypothetical protein
MGVPESELTITGQRSRGADGVAVVELSCGQAARRSSVLRRRSWWWGSSDGLGGLLIGEGRRELKAGAVPRMQAQVGTAAP